MGPKSAISKPERKRQQQTGVYHDGVTKTTRSDSTHQSRAMTMDQLGAAAHLTMAFSGSQRKDSELLEKMLLKYASKNTAPASPDTIAAVPHNKVVQARKQNQDWEAQAKQGIEKKGLRLDREWNDKTWTNKSNCNERLKLLKDDGFDITPLQGPDTDSDAITQALLTHVAARKRNPSQSGPQVNVSSRTDSQDPVEEVAEAPTPSLDPAFAHHLYHPLPTSRLKRKQSTACDSISTKVPYSHLHTDDDEPAYKKQCTTDLREDATMQATTEENMQSWVRLKLQVTSEIFKRDEDYPISKDDVSRISIAFPSQSIKADVPGSLELNSKGYDNIMKELRVFGGDTDEDGNFEIPNLLPFDRRNITVTTNVSRRTIIEGDIDALTGLLKRLATPGKGLAFMAKKSFNEKGNRFEENELFELSNATQNQLREIMEELEAKVKDGRVEVQVRWVA
jgi:hypothetical protein